MAVKEVTEIPKPIINPKHTQPFKYTDKLISDIKYAYHNNLSKFEFIGYDDNPDYVCTYAKQIAFRFMNEILYKPARKEVKEILQKELNKEQIYVTHYYASNNYAIRIHGVTLEDGKKHIYAEINYEWIANFKNDLLIRMREINKGDKIK